MSACRAAVVASAVAWLEAKDARSAAWNAYRAHAGTREAWDGFVVAEQREREALLAASAAVRALEDPPLRHPVAALAVENERLRTKNVTLRAQITQMRIDAEKRNRQLDALHLVWCGGACGRDAAVHRLCGSPDDITEDVVIAAERNTAALRVWWSARQEARGPR